MGSNVDQLIQETQPLALSRSFHFLFQIMSQVNNFKAAAATTVAVLRLDWSLFLLIWADNNQNLNPGRAGKGGGVRGKATMSRRSLLHFSALKIKISWYHREIRVRDKSFNFCPTVAATLSVEQRKLQIFIKLGLISPIDSLRLIFHSRIRIQPLSFNSIVTKKWRCQSCDCFSSSADFEAEAVSLCTWAVTVGFDVKSADGE